MFKLLRFLIYLVILAAVGLLIYSYVVDFAPVPSDIVVPVDPDALGDGAGS